MTARTRMRWLALIGGLAAIALVVAVALSMVRPAGDVSAAPTPSASASPSLTPSAAITPVPTASTAAPSGGVKPDSTHGIITFDSIRTEADPRNLQSPPQFARGTLASFNSAVSPDGTRVAMIRSSETGQELIWFATSRPNDVSRMQPLVREEFARAIVWAGDGSDSVLITAEQQTRGPGGGDNVIVDYSILRSVDLKTRETRDIARISGQSNSLHPLAWLPSRQLAGALEVRPLGPVANYVLVRGTAVERSNLNTGASIASFSASRDGSRIAAVVAPAVRWWPVDQPGTAKEMLADSRGRAESAAFRPGTDELGVNVSAASAGAGVPPPGHFEIWNITTGAQRVVAPQFGFQFWRVDGTAALQGNNLIDPQTGVITQIPGGPIKIADVVRFTEPVSVPTATPLTTPIPPPPGAQSPAAQVSIGGRSFRIADAYLWRDFMPVSEPGGKPLAASIKIQVDSGEFPNDVTADHVWVHGPTTWEPTNIEIRRAPTAGTSANQLEVFANGGPKWDPGTEVGVDVRLVSGSTTRTLRMTGVTINRTS